MSSQHETLFRDAERHLEALRTTVQTSGGPCHTCIHGTKRGGFSWDRKCRHPFVRRGTHNAVTGEITWQDGDQRNMRDGSCGAAGTLHERAPALTIAWRWLRWQWWIFIVLGALTEILVLTWGLSR